MSKSYDLSQHYPPMESGFGKFTKKGSGTYSQQISGENDDDDGKFVIISFHFMLYFCYKEN